MPVEEGLGLDQEHRPAGSRELAAQRCQQGAILGLQPGPWMLATQDHEFVTQHEDLDFLGLSRSAAEHDQLEDVAQRQVEERPDHRHLSRGRQGTTAHRSPSQGRASPLVTSTIDFWHPTREALSQKLRLHRCVRGSSFGNGLEVGVLLPGYRASHRLTELIERTSFPSAVNRGIP